MSAKSRTPTAVNEFRFTQSSLITTKLCGANEAQRSLRPNERLVMCRLLNLLDAKINSATPHIGWGWKKGGFNVNQTFEVPITAPEPRFSGL